MAWGRQARAKAATPPRRRRREPEEQDDSGSPRPSRPEACQETASVADGHGSLQLPVQELNLFPPPPEERTGLGAAPSLVPRAATVDLTSPFEDDCQLILGPASGFKRRRVVEIAQPLAFETSRPSPSRELSLTCAVCMDTMKEESSTVCGHIFCKACILDAIRAQHRCPTCRRRLAPNQVHRIYLSSSAG
eukprot:SM001924S05197  [mRNA]  locus=s1924:798:1771:- [translate_table: standard]